MAVNNKEFTDLVEEWIKNQLLLERDALIYGVSYIEQGTHKRIDPLSIEERKEREWANDTGMGSAEDWNMWGE